MPTPHRRAHLKTRARYDFEDSRAETDMEEIRACMMLGETQLDTILVQVVCSMPTGAAAPLCPPPWCFAASVLTDAAALHVHVRGRRRRNTLEPL
jgi:hypothetical protein